MPTAPTKKAEIDAIRLAFSGGNRRREVRAAPPQESPSRDVAALRDFIPSTGNAQTDATASDGKS
jgi:hypothetical protein